MLEIDCSECNVTIIVPLHNHEDYILDALNSIIIQDYINKRICVINDGSEDNSFNVVKNAIEDQKEVANNHIRGVYKDTPIILLSSKVAGGPSAARNKGIKATMKDTDAYMMLDSDDKYLEGKISKSVRVFEKDSEAIGIVYTDALIHNNKKDTYIHEYRQPYSRIALEQECIISNTPLINKRAFEKVGLYDESMRTCEDWDLWLRITHHYIASHIAEPLHIYTVTGKNASDIVDPKIWQENWEKIRYKMAERRGEV